MTPRARLTLYVGRPGDRGKPVASPGDAAWLQSIERGMAERFERDGGEA